MVDAVRKLTQHSVTDTRNDVVLAYTYQLYKFNGANKYNNY